MNYSFTRTTNQIQINSFIDKQPGEYRLVSDALNNILIVRKADGGYNAQINLNEDTVTVNEEEFTGTATELETLLYSDVFTTDLEDEDEGGGSSYLSYNGALKTQSGGSGLEEMSENQLGGSFIRDGAGVYILSTTTAWPGVDKIFANKGMYPLKNVLYVGAAIRGFWSMDIYDDGEGDDLVVTIQLEVFDADGNPIDLGNLTNTFFYLPEIKVFS